MLVFSTDKKRLLTHFQKDEVLFSYHIGDLDDFFFEHCQWYVDYAERARIEECILLYTGLEKPAVIAFGVSERFPGLLEEALPILPTQFFCHFHAEHRSLFHRYYTETELGTHQKMKLVSLRETVKGSDKIIRLDESHYDKLKQLYTKAYPGHYFIERMLLTKKYFGYFENDKIVAVAGVHVNSDKYKIAILGNITTDPDFRGKGLATAVTSKLVEELVKEKKMVGLNVKADNVAAIRCYEKLGFVKTHDYEEALFTLK